MKGNKQGSGVADFRYVLCYLHLTLEKTLFASSAGIVSENNQNAFSADHFSALIMGLCFATFKRNDFSSRSGWVSWLL